MVIETLKKLQSTQQLNDTQMGDMLGIHRTTWQRVKNYHQEPSSKFLITVMRVFPELRSAVDIFLSGDATKQNSIVGIDATPPETTPNRFLARLTGWAGILGSYIRRLRA